MDTSEISVRRGTPEDDAAIIAMLNRSAPDMPPASVATMRHNDTTTPAGTPRERYVAERGGRVVGYFMLQNKWWTGDPASFGFDLTVDAEERGRGVGTRLYERAVARAGELQAARLYVWVREDAPESMRFAIARGFEPSGHTRRMARLTVGPMLGAALDAGRQAREAAGIRITSLAELGIDESLLRAVYAVDSESGQDEPGAQSYEPPPFEQWREWILSEPGVSPEWFWIALDGERPVGLTYLVVHNPKRASTGYTGVARAYRGRGVASALKSAAVRWAAANGIQYIYTGNDLTNAPMLAINSKLGFQPLPASVELVKQR
jgi:GNAT superfamily N-acetyltransferase